MVYGLALALCAAAAPDCAYAQEAPRDSGSLIKPPTIKPPTARTQAGKGGATAGSKVRRLRRRRARRRAAAVQTAPGPSEVRGTVMSSTDTPSVVPPGTVAAPPQPAPRPRRPVSLGVLNGKALSLPRPPYPPIARAAGASGTVVVRVLIDEDGRVLEAEAVSGHPLLRQAAQQAALAARFSPTQLSGQPVKVTGVITYDFVQ